MSKQLFVMAHQEARRRAVAAIQSAPDGYVIKITPPTREDKTCTKCSETKKKSEFGNHKKSKDGLRGWCKPCCRIKSKEWNANNPDVIAKAQEKWNSENPGRKSGLEMARKLANPERYKLISAEYRNANRKKCNDAVAKWGAANPEKRRIYRINRRARIYADGGKLSHGLAAKLFKLQRGKCACCHVSIADANHLDHIIPIAIEGPNEDWNMQLLCAPCNLSKGAKHPVDFMQQRGFLL